MRFLPSFLRGGSDELGFDDLVRRSVKAIAKLARYGARGEVVFPAEVTVRVEVGDRGVDVIRGFVARPELDSAVGAALANEADCEPTKLPLRAYVVATGDATRVLATESPARAWSLSIEGGDGDVKRVVLPLGRAELRFGRGPFHGGDQHVRNDVVLPERSEFVSRRAGRIFQSGAQLEVESLDQGDALFVRRPDGTVVRPSRTAKGRVPVRDGDAIAIDDGRGGALRMIAAREPREGDARGGHHT